VEGIKKFFDGTVCTPLPESKITSESDKEIDESEVRLTELTDLPPDPVFF
jgi:hypothetical protein